MKRILCAVLCLALLSASFAACAQKQPDVPSEPQSETDSDTGAETKYTYDLDLSDAKLAAAFAGITERPVVTVFAERREYRPGETFTVTYKMADAKKVACFDLRVPFDSTRLTLTDYTTGQIEDMYFEEQKTDKGLLYFGFCVRTVDLDDETLLTLTFRVNDDAPAGEASADIAINAFQVGIDKDGADVANMPDVTVPFSVTVTA